VTLIGLVGGTVAIAIAPDPAPPLIVTVGTEVYPEPAFVRVKLPTVVGVMDALAVAFLPPPPDMPTVGAEVNPEPGLVRVMDRIATAVKVAVAVAFVPRGLAAMATVGADV